MLQPAGGGGILERRHPPGSFGPPVHPGRGRLAQLAGELSVVGPRIFDLQIGLMAFEGGATKLWTADRRFASPPGLPAVPALEA